MKGQNKLFIAIIIALILGVGIGGMMHLQYPESAEPFSKNIKLLGTVFIRLVQMIIAPLVFTTLVVGIAKMSDIKGMNANRGSRHFIYVNRTFFGLYNMMHDLKSKHIVINNYQKFIR